MIYLLTGLAALSIILALIGSIMKSAAEKTLDIGGKAFLDAGGMQLVSETKRLASSIRKKTASTLGLSNSQSTINEETGKNITMVVRISESEREDAYVITEKGELIEAEKGELIEAEKGELIEAEKGELIEAEKGELIEAEKGELIGAEKGELIGADRTSANNNDLKNCKEGTSSIVIVNENTANADTDKQSLLGSRVSLKNSATNLQDIDKKGHQSDEVIFGKDNEMQMQMPTAEG